MSPLQPIALGDPLSCAPRCVQGQCQKPPRESCPPCDPSKPIPVPKNFHPTCHFMHGRHNPTPNPGTVSGSCAPPPSPPPAVNCVGGKCVRFDRGTDTAAAAALAKTMDVAVVFVATTSSEGSDRKSLNLDDNGNELVSAVAAANPNTVVVAATPGALLTPWRDSVKSILVNFMPGRTRTVHPGPRTHHLADPQTCRCQRRGETPRLTCCSDTSAQAASCRLPSRLSTTRL